MGGMHLMRIFQMMFLVILLLLLSSCADESNSNNVDCTKVSNNKNGTLAGTVSCTFTTFTGEKQISFGLKNKPKPEVISISYSSTVSSGTVFAKLNNDSGNVHFEKNLTSGSNESTIDLSLVETDELFFSLKGTKASGTINFKW